ncbi:DUF2255 family protein [Streptomyces sp. 900116325]
MHPPTPIWVVRDGDNLYVRAHRGRSGAWFRTARATHTSHITAGGLDRDVIFTEVDDPALAAHPDGAYRTKYARCSTYVPPIVADTARAATLRLTPA